jgi:hypothetical protein
MFRLSSPVQSIVNTLLTSIREDNAQVFTERRLVETLEHRHAVRGPWAQNSTSRAELALWNRRDSRRVFVIFVCLDARNIAKKLVANTFDVSVAEHL